MRYYLFNVIIISGSLYLKKTHSLLLPVTDRGRQDVVMLPVFYMLFCSMHILKNPLFNLHKNFPDSYKHIKVITTLVEIAVWFPLA